MIKDKYIREFEKKHGLIFYKEMEKGVLHFNKGHYFEIDDIIFDIDHNIQKGLIMLYAKEGLNNGGMPNYRTWLANNFEGTI